MSWDEFTIFVCKKFGSREDVVEEFNKLVYKGGVNKYVERFED
jgi:hypothetical protein